MSLVPNSRFMNELLVIWPTQPARSPSLGEGEELCHEGHGHRVGALADVGVLGAVDLVEGLVLDCDVGRVADDDVVAAFFQHGQEEWPVLGGVREGHEGASVGHAGEDVGVGAVDEGVADRQVEGERWGGFQGREARRLAARRR